VFARSYGLRCVDFVESGTIDDMTVSELTMYTTTWCGYCVRLKTALKAKGITWDEIDIEEDPAAAKFVQEANNGNQTVPTVKFADGSTMTNPSIKDVKAKLAKVSQ
jgi:mycoredoxin